ncbi:hypothetical protein FACS189425_01460 [Clostridia bacterium]|nr:hypothetical protein FACS189425_01460 [Clostridia bacterium]
MRRGDAKYRHKQRGRKANKNIAELNTIYEFTLSTATCEN